MRSDLPDPAERQVLEAEDLYVAELLGDYIGRRDAARPLRVMDLLVQAAEFSAEAEHKLLLALAFYETMLARERA